MFIDPVDSYKLVKSVQRDYRKAAEDYRQMKEADIQQTGIPSSIKVGVALCGISSLMVAIGQFFLT
jgi:hypothetical protein